MENLTYLNRKKVLKYANRHFLNIIQVSYWRSVSQEISDIFRTERSFTAFSTTPPPVPILSHMNPVQILVYYFFNEDPF
jgi:hypothetical protein